MTLYLKVQTYTSTETYNYIGTCMSCKGTTVVASGGGPTYKRAYFFDFINGLLVKQTTEIALPEVPYGCCLSGDGKVIVFGCPIASLFQNRILVYDKVGSSWVRRTITINTSWDYGSYYFGYSVATNYDGSFLVAGCWLSPGYNGFVSTFRLNGNMCDEVSILQAPTGYTDVKFGFSVAMDNQGSFLAVGSPRKTGTLSYQGDVSFFFFDGNNWKSKDTRPPIISPYPLGSEYFGSSLFISDDLQTLMVGAAVYVYKFSYNNATLSWTGDTARISQNMTGSGVVFLTGGEFNYVIVGVPVADARVEVFKQVRRFVSGIVRQAGIGVVRTIYVTSKSSFSPFTTFSSNADGTWFLALDIAYDDNTPIDVIVKSNDMSKNNDVLYKVIPYWEF